MKVKSSCKKIGNILLAGFWSIIFLFVFFTMNYVDGIVNAYVGYGICNSIMHGTFGQYFHSVSWSYGLTIYIIYAIWSIPVVIGDMIQGKMTDISMDRSVILWYKCLLLLFFIICCYFFFKIVMELVEDKEKGKLFTLLLATSSLMFFIPLAITQCDVISLAFSLAGVFFLIKKNDAKFILCFAFAITMKYLPLFIFIPLFLYRYKKPKQIIPIGIGASGLLIISAIILSFSKGARQAMENPAFFDVASQVRGFFEGNNISLGMGNMSVVVAYYVAICVIAHMIQPESETAYKQWISWLCLAGWYTLIIFFGANVYWYVLIAPFVILIILNNPKYFGFGLFIEIVLTNFMLLERANTQYWVFGGGYTFTSLMLRDILHGHTTLLRKLFDRVTFGLFSTFEPIYVSIIVVMAFALLIIFRPQKEKKQELIQKKSIKIAIWIHVIILYIWSGLMLGEAIRLTKGTEYGVEYFSYSDNVKITDDGAVLSPGESQICPYFSLEPGLYRLSIEANGVHDADIRLSYYYNEDIPIAYSILELDDDGAIIEFEIDTYIETVQFQLINSGVDDIVFHSYILSEVR